VKDWEIIADKTAKPVGVEVASQRLIPAGEQSELPTHIATTESVLLRARMKGSPHFSNSNQ
jgi:hypothetical protein